MRKYRSVMRWDTLLAAILAAASAVAEPLSPAESFRKLIDRPRVPLAAQTAPLAAVNGLERHRFSFVTEAGERVPGVLIKPSSGTGKLPVVIALHGTGGNKDSSRVLLTDLARKGFLAVAIDARYHGERTKAGSGTAEYVDAIVRAYRTGQEHPFYYDTVWDVRRLLDYLETRPDVDADRIGLIGFSKGGIEAYLAAAVEPRIRAAVPCIGVQSFRWALDHEAWRRRIETIHPAVDRSAKHAGAGKLDAAFVRQFYDRVVPGIYAEFDGPSMLPLIAPRPLLVINGDSDPLTPRPGLLETIAAAKDAYARAGAADRFEFLLQANTGHTVNPEALRTAIDFLTRWLAQPASHSSP